MLRGRFLGQEEARGFDDDVGADVVPLELGRILDCGQADFPAVDDKRAALDGDGALEASVHGIVLETVGEVVGLEQVVNADHFDVGKIAHRGAKHHAADAAESIDAHFDRHAVLLITKEMSLSGRVCTEAVHNSQRIEIAPAVACLHQIQPSHWKRCSTRSSAPNAS